MSMANVAWALAENYGKKVLVVDWDLEAPGLHRFFSIENKDVGAGLIDMLYDYKDLLRGEPESLPEKLTDVRKYITPVQHFKRGGSISLLAAGRQDEKYASRINEFSWEEFYAKWHGFGFIEHLKQELKTFDDTEIILVDSRTGVTDIGGICTLQLPDVVVLLFALNDQNIRGAESVAEKISKKALEIEGRDRPPLLIIRPSRVERTGNQEEKIRWQQIAALRLGEYLSGADREEPQRFMAKKNIPYIGDYSYGETPLAMQKDPLGEMADSFDELAKSILQAAEPENLKQQPSSLKNSYAYYLRKKLSLFLMKRKNVYLTILAIILISLSGLFLSRIALLSRRLEASEQQSLYLRGVLDTTSDELNILRQRNKELLESKDTLNAIRFFEGKRGLAVQLAYNLKEKNIPFAPGGRNPETGFDTSGFIDHILSQPEIGLIRNVSLCDQQCLMRLATPAATLSELRPGDLIYYEYSQTMMYLGNGKCIGMMFKGANDTNGTIEIKDVDFAQKIGIMYGKVPYDD